MLQDDVRRTILKALFADAALYDHLVLKNGNALTLVYGIGGRSSLDLDFSMPDDFADLESVAERIEHALVETFRSEGIDVFDFSLTRKPSQSTRPWWGGYLAEFKLIPSTLATALGNDPVHMSRQAMTISPGSQRRRYPVEISKYEFVEGFISTRVDNVNVKVYSPALIAAEKLRALLQQHPDYPRVEAVFEAKQVDMELLSRVEELKAFHQGDWADVENSVSGEIERFEFYFGFVAEIAQDLHAKWIEHAP